MLLFRVNMRGGALDEGLKTASNTALWSVPFTGRCLNLPIGRSAKVQWTGTLIGSSEYLQS